MERTTCVITFDQNPSKVYFGGQTLQGRAVLKLHKPKNVRGIYIKIEGNGYCHWTEGSGDNKKTYTGEECYLSEKTYVAGGPEGEVTVGPGTFEYGFQCRLPLELPTSVESEHGHIRYTVILNLDRPHWPDQEFEEAFTVIRFIDLNVDPIHKMRQIKDKHKTFYPCCCCCCFASDPLILTATLPYTGYTPGQQISVSINVNNKSDQPVDHFEVKLTKHITYHTYKDSTRTKDDYDTVTEVTERGMQAFNRMEIHSVLSVPPIPPTDVTSSNICKLKYRVDVEAVINGCHNNALVAIPITIGSVPIMDNLPPSRSNDQIPITTQPLPQQAPGHIGFSTGLNSSNEHIPMPPLAPMPMPMPSTAPDASAPLLSDVNHSSNNPPVPYDETSPPYEQELPTYEEAIYGNNTGGGKVFKPRYPMYRRTQSKGSDG